MAENSAIEWTDHTFNPWIGCTKVGPGCDHCYAEALATTRLGVLWGAGAPRRRTARSTWHAPCRWNARAARNGRRERVFCASLADVFDNEVHSAWRADLFALARETPWLDWQLVTKRIGNARRMAEEAGGWPANVWLGATVVNQAEADRDVPKLLAVEGPRLRFLSMEPLLGPVDLRKVPLPGTQPGQFDALTGNVAFTSLIERGGQVVLGPLQTPAIDWIIVGGESGPGARPMHPDWLISLRDQCEAASVPFLFKQWGEWAPVCAIDENRVSDEQLYHPRLARHQPEGPQRCKVTQLVMQASGRIFPMDEWSRVSGEDPEARDFAYSAGAGAMQFMAIGKARAGRHLDGVTHDGLPASSGERPVSLPLTDPDAPAVAPADVSAPEAAQSRHTRSRPKPETAAP